MCGPRFGLQADFKLMCDNAMVYNRPETVYYKAAKKLLHTGFKMMSKVREGESPLKTSLWSSTTFCCCFLFSSSYSHIQTFAIRQSCHFLPLPCAQERLLALKRSMSFMQEMDFTQQAAILGDEDLTADIPPPEIIPTPVESAKKSKKQPVKDMKEVIRYFLFVISEKCVFFCTTSV